MNEIRPINVINQESSDAKALKPFGFWSTIGISFGAYIVDYICFYSLIFVIYICAGKNIQQNGLDSFLKYLYPFFNVLDSFTVFVVYPAIFVILIFMILFFKKGDIRDYFGFKRVGFKVFTIWIFVAFFIQILILLFLYFCLINNLIPKPWKPVDYVGAFPFDFLCCIINPLVTSFFEEVFFRGFMYQGIRKSKAGAIGAILITSLLWALGHSNEIFFFVFLDGLVLGAARKKTGSTYVTFGMHLFVNLICSQGVILQYFSVLN
jgi:uncharacterized protein